jgi:hypothetical protein
MGPATFYNLCLVKCFTKDFMRVVFPLFQLLLMKIQILNPTLQPKKELDQLYHLTIKIANERNLDFFFHAVYQYD